MSWLEDYNGDGARWWHVIVLLVPIISFIVYAVFFGGDSEVWLDG
tara:strand:+ start:30499 stop:30633 length:135 start_codon:yes stop_codon:yes gene_type:complete